MSKRKTHTPLAAAVGAAFATSLLGATVANADVNPFSMSELSHGYQLADAKGSEGQCGASKTSNQQGQMDQQMSESKSGSGAMSEDKDGHDGAMESDKMKTTEGKCGANK